MIQSNERKRDTHTTALYCRVATHCDMGIEKQSQSLLQFATEQGYKNPVFYTDNGVSGLTLNRPAFTEMEKAIARGEVNTIIVMNISRIGRNSFEVMRWIDNCEKANVMVISVMDDMIPLSLHNCFMAYVALAKGGSRQ